VAVRRVLAALSVVAAAALLAGAPLVARPRPFVVWFTPAPGSLDMLRLFEAGDEWAGARSAVSVFKFYQQHFLDPPPSTVGPNTYGALRAAGAFRIVSQVWHKRLAVEVGAVKPHYCTADASGMNAAVRDTLAVIGAAHDAGGTVNDLAMDEPFLSGVDRACGGPDPAATLTRLERYFAGVRLAAPDVRIGLIEPYPFFSAKTLDGFLVAMTLRGIRPAFFHLDVDLDAIRGPDTLAQDLRFLAGRCASAGMAFGIIFWGHSGDSDALYVEDAMRLVGRVNDAFPGSLPPHLVFQSWALSRTGLLITPANLPEGAPNTHTTLIDAALPLLERPQADQPPRAIGR
jgi:hypothetical protein